MLLKQFLLFFPLASELKEVDLQLERAEHALNWNSEGIWNYIENLRSTVTDLAQRVAKTQQNVEEVTKIMQQWKDQPLYKRTDTGAKENLLDLKGMYNNYTNIVYLFETNTLMILTYFYQIFNSTFLHIFGKCFLIVI